MLALAVLYGQPRSGKGDVRYVDTADQIRSPSLVCQHQAKRPDYSQGRPRALKVLASAALKSGSTFGFG